MAHFKAFLEVHHWLLTLNWSIVFHASFKVIMASLNDTEALMSLSRLLCRTHCILCIVFIILQPWLLRIFTDNQLKRLKAAGIVVLTALQHNLSAHYHFKSFSTDTSLCVSFFPVCRLKTANYRWPPPVGVTGGGWEQAGCRAGGFILIVSEQWGETEGGDASI